MYNVMHTLLSVCVDKTTTSAPERLYNINDQVIFHKRHGNINEEEEEEKEGPDGRHI